MDNSPLRNVASGDSAHATSAAGLDARITHARIRMLYGHMPVTAWTLCGFTLVIGGLIHFTLPTPATLPTQAWLLVALVLAVTRALHAQAYFRSGDRQAPFWQHSYHWLPWCSACAGAPCHGRCPCAMTSNWRPRSSA